MCVRRESPWGPGAEERRLLSPLALWAVPVGLALGPRVVASAGSHEKRRSRPEFFKQGLSHSYMTRSAQLASALCMGGRRIGR